jgi:hypothetical protein
MPIIDKDKIIPATPERVFLTWTIHNSCNYRCSYCFVTTGYRDVFLTNTYPGTEQVIAAWDRIYSLYGSCIIKIAGGEPFTYPDFMRIVVHLSQKHFLDFSSNLFWDVDEFVRSAPKDSARIEPSYHPEFCPDRAEFADKCLKLKSKNFMGSVHMVGYPTLIQKMIEAKDYFESRGLNSVILPFRGKIGELEYPNAYTDEEKTLLKMAIAEKPKPAPAPAEAPVAVSAGTPAAPAASPAPAAPPVPAPSAEDEKAKKHIREVNERYFDWYVKEKNHMKDQEVRWCLHGAYYGKIQPNGDVLRCCTPVAEEKKKDLLIGNFWDPNFRLLEGAKQCDITPCFCWKPMLMNEDEKWKPLWKFETYSRPDGSGAPKA